MDETNNPAVISQKSSLRVFIGTFNDCKPASAKNQPGTALHFHLTKNFSVNPVSIS
jgi:hypothetical protein